jgi:hypothetical protein
MATPPDFTAGQVLTAAQMNKIGEFLITRVTISAAATTNVNNCFSPDYKNYRLVSNLTTSSNTGVAIRLRVGGSDNTTANYGCSYRYTALHTSNAGDASSTGQTQWNLQISNLCRALNMNLIMFAPQATDYTTATFNNVNADGGVTNHYAFMGGLSFDATTSFDGFSIYTGGAPTISGTIDIYGITEG